MNKRVQAIALGALCLAYAIKGASAVIGVILPPVLGALSKAL